MTSALQPGGSESYGYDAVGNRTSSHLSATYGYEAVNKLTSTASATYTYNNNGNMLSTTDGSGTRNFAWDSDNRLEQVALPGGLTVNYQYDALGRRTQRTTSDGADERFVYDGQDVLLDLDSSLAVTTSYLNGPGIDNHLRQTNTSTGVSYFITDHLGTTAALADSSGAVVETLSYDSFGANAGSTRTRYTYTGRERDPDTGLLYYRARFYDPRIGRFISEDPLGLAGGVNLFGYVANNPVSHSDPSGLCPQNPSTITVPLDAKRLEGLMNDTLKYGDCADYITRLINRAAEQTGKPPESTNIMALFEKIKSQPQGGILFDRNDIPGHPEIPPVAGGGGWAWGWYPQGNAMINIYRLSYFSDNPRGASRIPYAYGERGVHEVIHLSAKGGLGYNEAELTKAARSLEPNGSFMDWDGALKNHCMPPQFR